MVRVCVSGWVFGASLGVYLRVGARGWSGVQMEW